MHEDSIGTVAALWRFPVKSMQGEAVATLALDRRGVVGDRRYGIRSTGAPLGKRLLSGAERAAMLRFQARFQGGAVRVTTPGGAVLDINDPALLRAMETVLPGNHALSLLASESPLTDVRPVALLGSATVQHLSRSAGPVDPRRFRANLLLDMPEPFAEDRLCGSLLRVGASAVLRILERTPRCRMVTLHPETGEPAPALMKHLDRHHAGRVGVYASVVQAGVLHVGDIVHSDIAL